MESDKTVTFSDNGNGVGIITLSRLNVSNALNSQMAIDLKEIFERRLSGFRSIILTGDGEKAFCAGADLKERQNMTADAWQKQHQLFRHIIKSIMECQMPIIAAVNGAAYGGGLEMALACDFIYAARNAHFALPEATLGIMPGMGGTQNLPRAVGLRMAKELMFTGQKFSAEEAYSWGMVNKICESGNLMSEVISCANKIAAAAPLSIEAIRRVSTHNMHMAVGDSLVPESTQYNRLLYTKDRNEGVTAFNEKRQPSFTGN